MEEIWKLIENTTNYYASNLGRVKVGERQQWNNLCNCYSTFKERILAPTESQGYLYVEIGYKDGTRKRERLHRIIAKTFIPNPDNLPMVNHKDGNKHNNNVENLEWCTNSQNTQHAYDTGLIDKKKFTSINSSRATPYLLITPQNEQLIFGTQRELREYLEVSKTVFRSPKYQTAMKNKGYNWKLITKEQYFTLKSSTTIPLEV